MSEYTAAIVADGEIEVRDPDGETIGTTTYDYPPTRRRDVRRAARALAIDAELDSALEEHPGHDNVPEHAATRSAIRSAALVDIDVVDERPVSGY